MALLSGASRSGTARAALNMRPDLVVNASVDVDEPVDMTQRVWAVLSGPNLEMFLKNQVHPYFENQIVQRFAYQGDRQVGHWPDLSPATVAIREHDGFGGDWPINIRTEEMFHTVTEEADFFASASSAEMSLPGSAGASGTVAQKIKTAQQGKPAPNPMSPNFGPTPPRPVLAADETDLVALMALLSRWVIWEVLRGIS